LTIRELDYAQVDTYGQVLEEIEFLEFTSKKVLAEVNGTVTAPSITDITIPPVVTDNWCAAIGFIIHWQVAYQQTSPVTFRLSTKNFYAIGQLYATLGAPTHSVDRTFTGDLAPRMNGGDIYVPFVYRKDTTMDRGAAQIGFPDPAGDPPAGALIRIEGPPAAVFTFVARPLGAFNLETGRYIDNITQVTAKKVAS